MVELPKRFAHAEAEKKWYERWEKEGAFRADPTSSKPAYSIVIPPPNVTGALHMGHALNNTIQDIYARYKRMNGFDVLWLPGTDHAGIATQNVVEKQLAEEGRTRDDLGREAFVERVWEWKKKSGGTIVKQLRRLGASCDWSRERFTMDEGLSRAVRQVFVSLFEEGLIYRAYRLVNWCTRCRTALSDIEVEHEERRGHLWHIRYPFADGSGEIVIATTRPETMLGDTAVAVHPDDERYANLVGRELILPLVGRRIQLIADEYVDREFGSGAVKITPGHDPNDYEIGLRHNLQMIKAFTDRGFISEEIRDGAREPWDPSRYIGMELMECRRACLEDLEKAGLLVKTEDHEHAIGHCYRCKTPVEPFLTPQWFVKTEPLARDAIAAVEEERTRIVPRHWTKTYFEWMRNIRDWCISRQIWWGHRIPAWYCRSCSGDAILDAGSTLLIDTGAEPIVSETEPSACPKCGGTELVRDPDVLDTWFSSALWPFSTMGWPEETAELRRYYPTSLLVTGFDILFFWVARMMMMGLKFRGDVPFYDVYIHALVRDAEGRKMSKTKGNVIDPLEVIEEMGADAFRFTLAAFCAQGRDIKLDERRIEGYRNFVTKIWNAARFTFALHAESGDEAEATGAGVRNETEANRGGRGEGTAAKGEEALEDRWIRSRLRKMIRAVRTGIDSYNIDRAADALYAFFWREFCDWYLEVIKPRCRSGDSAAPRCAREVLEVFLRAAHPFMPFVTEELHEIASGTGFLDFAPFPSEEEFSSDEEAEARFERMREVITLVRRLRAEFGVQPGTEVSVLLVDPRGLLGAEVELLRTLARAVPKVVSEAAPAKGSAVSVVGAIQVILPLEGVVDIEEQRKRLTREKDRLEGLINSSRKRLENEGFLEKAPPAVVEQSRRMYEELKEKYAKVGEVLEMLERV
ncbi:MAG: valine--tRNA ligase [Candidatus Hydrogenedentota bacterium]|nr:MAG: valine--tRNA ligase [Candidatus Hydrogenedentota bacterium]